MEKMNYLLAFVEMSGLLAPFAFIVIHILRQFFFIPVIVICLAGGLLFGSIFGLIYSLIGLTLSSFIVYYLLTLLPGLHKKLRQIRMKCFGPYNNLTSGQIAILKMIPLMHYQLLCFCLMERKKTFREYAITSFLTNIPTVTLYTIFGQFIRQFSPGAALIFIMILALLIVAFREKLIVIKWKDFFKIAS